MIDQAERLRKLMAHRENASAQQRKRCICVIYPERQDCADNFADNFAKSLKGIGKKTCAAKNANQAAELKKENDAVLFSLNCANEEIFGLCDEIIVVATNDSADILSTYAMIKENAKYSKKMQIVLITSGKESRAEKALTGFVKVLKSHTKKNIRPLGYIVDNEEIYYDFVLENLLN